MKNENVKKEEKKPKTFYSGESGFMTKLSGPVHAFNYAMNIKMRYIIYYSGTIGKYFIDHLIFASVKSIEWFLKSGKVMRN